MPFLKNDTEILLARYLRNYLGWGFEIWYTH